MAFGVRRSAFGVRRSAFGVRRSAFHAQTDGFEKASTKRRTSYAMKWQNRIAQGFSPGYGQDTESP